MPPFNYTTGVSNLTYQEKVLKEVDFRLRAWYNKSIKSNEPQNKYRLQGVNIMCIYGYCRISTAKQNIERQERNIKAEYPTAIIIKETYTGTKFQGRAELDKLLKKIKSGDTIIFDSVSRMSRNAAEGVELYMQLMDKDINLIFLKEHYIDTDTYKAALKNSIELTGNDIADIYIEATNKVLRLLAERQIILAFEQSEKEVKDLHQRTSEGLKTAALNGKQIGQPTGAKLTTKKSIAAKQDIIKYSKDFGGSLNDKEVMRMIGIARNTYYKYKRELTNSYQCNMN